jgi:hypothetical protein
MIFAIENNRIFFELRTEGLKGLAAVGGLVVIVLGIGLRFRRYKPCRL